MFLIVNDKEQIVAASKSALEALAGREISDILDAIRRREILMDRAEARATLGEAGDAFELETVEIESLLGPLTLIRLRTPAAEDERGAKPSDSVIPLSESTEEKAPESPAAVSQHSQEGEVLSLIEPGEAEIAEARTGAESLPESDGAGESETDEELLRLLDLDTHGTQSPTQSVESVQETPSLQEPSESVQEPLEILPVREEADQTEHSKEETRHEELPSEEALSADEFEAMIRAGSEELGVDEKEYRELLNEFIQDAFELKPDLMEEPKSRIRNLHVLRDALSLLHLRPETGVIEGAEDLQEDAFRETMGRFYRRLEAFKSLLVAATQTHAVAEQAPRIEEPRTAPEAERPASPQSTETAAVSKGADEEEVRRFLGEISPIPIEFSMHIAAEELNLPENLVKEFIEDFSRQAHEYLPVLIGAYSSGDLDLLQKTAHMLKGAASNLRIESMVNNLYELQYDQDLERAPERIRLFAGQMMSLDAYLERENS